MPSYRRGSMTKVRSGTSKDDDLGQDMTALQFPSEPEIPTIAPTELRFLQALYFYQEFEKSCGSPASPRHSWFHWIAYADAFLMAIISLKDMVSGKARRVLLDAGSA